MKTHHITGSIYPKYLFIFSNIYAICFSSPFSKLLFVKKDIAIKTLLQYLLIYTILQKVLILNSYKIKENCDIYFVKA